MKKNLGLIYLLFFGLILMVGCEKETPPPTVTFTANMEKVADGIVSFTAEVTNDTKYEWDFGDGSYINTLHAPIHTYAQFDNARDYEVSLTIKGPGGQTTTSQTISIPGKTKMQYLTGGTPTNVKSKKWRLNKNAASLTFCYANAALTQIDTYPGGILGSIGMSMAYSDAFTFTSDGKMSINAQGDGVLASLAYCMGTGTQMKTYYADAGLAYTKTYTAPANPTFAINENKNYTITTPLGPVTYPGVMTLSFQNEGFLVLKDFTTECIVQTINDTKMDVVLFMAHPSYGADPMLAVKATLEAF
jgi:PKD repeat protein